MNTTGTVDPARNAPHSFAERPFKRGYRTPAQLKDALADAHRTRLGRSVFAAALDQLSALAAIVLSSWFVVARPDLWFLGVATFLLSTVFFGRQLRGLENLVHEASHFNWCRSRRKTNNLLGYLLAAMPVGAKLSTYRESHLLHHGRFGTAKDVDLQRYRELDLEAMPRDSVSGMAAFILRRFGRYQLGWVRDAADSPGASLAPFAWFTLVLTVPAAVWGGPLFAVVLTAHWLVAVLITLPLLRFVAESSEHVYSDSDTVFGATISNLGSWQRFLFHPHNDGFHTVHHLWPGIPHHRLRDVHRMLCAHDPEGYAARLRFRGRVLEKPVVGLRSDGYRRGLG